VRGREGGGGGGLANAWDLRGSTAPSTIVSMAALPTTGRRVACVQQGRPTGGLAHCNSEIFYLFKYFSN
jgi:hypothetical protein